MDFLKVVIKSRAWDSLACRKLHYHVRAYISLLEFVGFLERVIKHEQISKEIARKYVQDLRKHAENDRKAVKGKDEFVEMAKTFDELADAMKHDNHRGQMSKKDVQECIRNLRKLAENDRKIAEGKEGCALMAKAWDAFADAMEYRELETVIKYGQMSKKDVQECIRNLRKLAENDRKIAEGKEGCALMAKTWDAFADAMEYLENNLP